MNLDQPQPILIDELDEIEIIVESDGESSDEDCNIVGETKSNLMKKELLYNLKKEIKVDEKSAWRTLIVKSQLETLPSKKIQNQIKQEKLKETQYQYDYEQYNLALTAEKQMQEENAEQVRQYLLSDRCLA